MPELVEQGIPSGHAEAKPLVLEPVEMGIFAGTQLGGFYLIEARDLDEAVAWASKMPHVPHGGSVEIRPIMKFDG